MSEKELEPLREAFEENVQRREHEVHFTALQRARARVEELAGAVRSDAFDDWIRRCVVTADTPADWTQARVLYQSYVTHARHFGRNRAQRAFSVEERATETQWGRMMATQFRKKRRSAGWYYELRCKRSA